MVHQRRPMKSALVSRRHVNLQLTPRSPPTKHYFSLRCQPLNTPLPFRSALHPVLWPWKRNATASTTEHRPASSPKLTGSGWRIADFRASWLTNQAPNTQTNQPVKKKRLPNTRIDAPFHLACRPTAYARTCSRHSFANSVNASGFRWPSNSRSSSHPAHAKYPTAIHQWIC